MVDHAHLSTVLSDFAHTLVRRYDVGEVLYQLTDRTVDVLGVAGAGVSLMDENDKLRFVTATDEDTSRVERMQEDGQDGPCFQAHTRGEPVLIADIAAPDTDTWPGYRDQAVGAGFHAVAGIPMRLEDFRLGALDVYSREVGEWTDDDVFAARALADMATSLVINARELEQSRRVAEQLQRASTVASSSSRPRAPSPRTGGSPWTRPSACFGLTPGPTTSSCTTWPGVWWSERFTCPEVGNGQRLGLFTAVIRT